MAKTREIEYFRCWPGNQGDSGTWDTFFIEIPADTPTEDAALQAALQEAVDKVAWDPEPPMFVGIYCVPEEEEDDDVG